MKEYFNVKFEFDHSKVDQIISDTIINGGKGYVCSIEGNIIAIANQKPEFRNIINNALVNICDGSSIALLSSLIYWKRHKTYVGAELFINYIKEKDYRYFFLGNTQEVLNGLKEELTKINCKISDMKFITLPFKSVGDFDYKSIAEEINVDNPDIIWLSLGAPKQEEFMYRLLPYLNRGVMFGFGAIFNFNCGIKSIRRAPVIFQKLNSEWVFRLFQEPKKQFLRIKLILFTLPRMIIREIRKKKYLV